MTHIGKKGLGFLLPLLALLCIIGLLHSHPVPYGNEQIYLTIPQTLFEKGFLGQDWFFKEKWVSHLIFDLLSGAAIQLTSPEAVGIAGRAVCWILSSVLLLILGQRLKLSWWMAALAVAFWIIQGQALVGDEWMIGGFEAKCIAYILVLWGLISHINGNTATAAVLMGFSFCFHASVGMFAILAFGATLPAVGMSLKQMLKTVLITFISSLPGLLLLIPVLTGDNALNSEDIRFLVLSRMPYHLDPFSWSKRLHLTQILLFVFNCLVFYPNRHQRPFRVMFIFQASLGLFFAGGVWLRQTGWFEPLIYFPFRLFPLFVLLLFFYSGAWVCSNLSARQGRYLILIMLLAMMCLENPFVRIVDGSRSVIAARQATHDDMARAFKWIRRHTPPDTVILAPAWRKDAWYLTRRAQVLNTTAFPYDHRIAEFRERLAAIYRKTDLLPFSPQKMQTDYNDLSKKEIRTISQAYGAAYLVALRPYAFPLKFESGDCRVYLLP